MLNKLRNYINDNDFKINILKETINIVNYIDIILLEENRISIKYSDGIIVVKGEDLSVSKLLENEMIITGKFTNIEFKE